MDRMTANNYRKYVIHLQTLEQTVWTVLSQSHHFITFSFKNNNELVHCVNLSQKGWGNFVLTSGHVENDKMNGTSNRKGHCRLSLALLYTWLLKEANKILGCRTE